jgi:hypothetical protein
MAPPKSTPSTTQPKRAPRVETSITAKVTAGKRKDITFTIENISISGAKMEGPLALALKDTIGVVFTAEGKSIQVKAQVVRVDTADLMTDQIAVAFIDPDAETREALRLLVNKHLDGWDDDDDGDDTIEDPGDSVDTEIVMEPEE